MKRLQNTHVLLGVTGGIAAYKSAEIIRRLTNEGADVRVVMTSGAEAFVSEMTFQALSGNVVHKALLDPSAEAGMGHIELARWADAVIVAPASANFLSRFANGSGSDLLGTLCLATDAPVHIAPAMNQQMWKNKATQANIKRAITQGAHLIGPDSGVQACGDVGLGRMSQPEDIVEQFIQSRQTGVLSGKKVVITAGPTREAIDPVRYISNHSSGKMGYALAEACANAGADTYLVSGPVWLDCPERVTRIKVNSASDMHEAVFNLLDDCDLFIGAAAVADYRPSNVAEQKIKKSATDMNIEFVRNPDILMAVANHSPRPFTVGFAAESERVVEYARGKLERKSLDMIIANDISRKDIGFEQDDNEVILITPDNEQPIAKASKRRLATILVEAIAAQCSQ